MDDILTPDTALARTRLAADTSELIDQLPGGSVKTNLRSHLRLFNAPDGWVTDEMIQASAMITQLEGLRRHRGLEPLIARCLLQMPEPSITTGLALLLARAYTTWVVDPSGAHACVRSSVDGPSVADVSEGRDCLIVDVQGHNMLLRYRGERVQRPDDRVFASLPEITAAMLT